MVPRPIGSGAPQCTRCGKTVYMAEQVIGPYSKPYHKPCLTCVVCNKRLDSTLLLEHDGEPYCKNCHKTHLGQGKGGFGLSVPLRPEKPIALQSSPKPANGGSSGARSEAARRVEERLAEEMSGISITPRRDNTSPSLREPASPTTYQPKTRISTLSKPTTVAQSIDHLVSSGVEVPIPYSRAETSRPITNALYGDQEELDRGASKYDQYKRQEPDYHQEDDRWSSRYEERNSEPAFHQEESEQPPPVDRSSSPISRSTQSTDQYMPSTPTRGTEESYGSNRYGGTKDGLPAPQRKDPIALARERERGLYSTGTGTIAKTYSPRTTPVISPPVGSGGTNGSNLRGDPDQYGYSPNSHLAKMGLGSTVNAAAIGTPLCARCQRPVYFAEQKQAASRKWHRACLRCDGCATTLESGKLEEGPLSATYEFPTNVWCRTCYAKRFGPKGIGVAGMSLPENMK